MTWIPVDKSLGATEAVDGELYNICYKYKSGEVEVMRNYIFDSPVLFRKGEDAKTTYYIEHICGGEVSHYKPASSLQ